MALAKATKTMIIIVFALKMIVLLYWCQCIARKNSYSPIVNKVTSRFISWH